MIAWLVEESESILLGDVLALARRNWVRAMRTRLSQQGYDDYRRSDALALRFFSSGAHTSHHGLGAFGELTGTSRQAARKVVAGLIDRGYASLSTDPNDARRRHVHLTNAGTKYAEAVVRSVVALNRDIATKVDGEDLRTAIAVLAFVRDTVDH
jgi:DNA-binding MarR family transcriptional regulator